MLKKEIAMEELVWREPQVRKATGLSKGTRLRLMKDNKFPKKIKLSSRATGWLADEIRAWIEEKGAAREEMG